MQEQLLGQLFVIAAPSGAGKTSLVDELVKNTPGIQVSISHTTRPKRPGEEHGVNYFFVEKQEFDEIAAAGDFLESAEVFGNFYGTSKQYVLDTLKQGIDIILEIDWQGAQQIRKWLPDCVSIFILPPSIDVLHERLKKRAQDCHEVIAERMAKASSEMSHYAEYEYLVINDDFNVALAELTAIIQASRLKCRRQVRKHQQLITELLA